MLSVKPELSSHPLCRDAAIPPAIQDIEAHNSGTRSPNADLPDTLWQHVFAYGSACDLVEVTKVSRRWRQLGQAKAVSRACLNNTSITLQSPVCPQNSHVTRDALAAWVRAEAFLQRETQNGQIYFGQEHEPVPDTDFWPAITVSPQSRWLGMWHNEPTAAWHLRDLRDMGRPPLHFSTQEHSIGEMVFSPNEEWVAFAVATDWMHYQLPSGDRLPSRPSRHSSPPLAAAYSQNGKRFASVAKKDWRTEEIFLCDVGANFMGDFCVNINKQICAYPDDQGVQLAFHGHQLVLIGHYGAAVIDLQNEDPVIKVFGRSNCYPYRALWTNDHLRVVFREDSENTTFVDGVTHVYTDDNYNGQDISSGSALDTGTEVSEDLNWAVKMVQLDSEIDQMVACLFDLRFPTPEDLDDKRVVLPGSPKDWQTALFSVEAQRLVLVNYHFSPDSPALYVYDLNAPSERYWTVGHSVDLEEVVLTHQGQRALVRCGDGSLRLWNLELPAHTMMISDGAHSPSHAQYDFGS